MLQLSCARQLSARIDAGIETRIELREDEDYGQMANQKLEQGMREVTNRESEDCNGGL
jgi:hypothetical protein